MGARRLLVVDDEAEFREFVTQVGQELGFTVRQAGSAVTFRRLCAEFRPDLIVLDVVMPEVDGIELIQWLADSESHARVVVVTGYNPRYAELASQLAAAKGLFPVETLIKPVSLADMRTVLGPGETADG